MKQFLLSAVEIVEIILVAFGSVFLIKNFLVQPFLVSGSSMVPNFYDGDYLLIDEVTYRFRQPERGEVIVFRYPKDDSVYFIKRIIGLPGEKVQIRGGQLTVFNKANLGGLTLNESYLPKNVVTAGDFSFDVPVNDYLVLGDNRQYSFDSRNWGLLPANDVVGLVQLRLWPPTSLKVFAAPDYQPAPGI